PTLFGRKARRLRPRSRCSDRCRCHARELRPQGQPGQDCRSARRLGRFRSKRLEGCSELCISQELFDCLSVSQSEKRTRTLDRIGLKLFQAWRIDGALRKAGIGALFFCALSRGRLYSRHLSQIPPLLVWAPWVTHGTTVAPEIQEVSGRGQC